MAVLTKPIDRGGHWYTTSGQAMHTVLKKDGTPRATNLRDAKKMAKEGNPLLPSVTGVMDACAKFGLIQWKLKQAVLSAMVNPKNADESDEFYVKRVIEASHEQVSDAAALGSKIHDALEKTFATSGTPDFSNDLLPFVTPVIQWKKDHKIVFNDLEKCLVNTAEGYAGTADVLFSWGGNGIGILDYKTKRTEPGKELKPWPEYSMQLAAYAVAAYGEERLDHVLAANMFISVTEPGRVDVVKHENLREHYEAFKHVCAIWRYQKGYDPRKHI
jgi:hypothetical protein